MSEVRQPIKPGTARRLGLRLPQHFPYFRQRWFLGFDGTQMDPWCVKVEVPVLHAVGHPWLRSDQHRT